MSGAGVGVLGIYASRREAEEALDLFRLSGYKTEEISAVLPRGTTVGGVFSWLSSVETVEIKGVGLLTAGGPIKRTIAEGGLTKTLAALGASKVEAKLCESRVKSGGGLVAVHCGDSDWLGRARNVFERSGATEVLLVGKQRTAAAGGA